MVELHHFELRFSLIFVYNNKLLILVLTGLHDHHRNHFGIII